MIEVRLRHVDQADGVRLMDWDPTDLEGAMKLVTAWSVRYAEDGTEYAHGHHFSGQIVVDGNLALFEILMNDGNGE